jgi:mRNA interferase RelE/StbE
MHNNTLPHRIVAAASRFGAIGMQVLASAGRFSWNASRTVESFRDVGAVPVEFAERLLAGESPLEVWRDDRGLTLQTLAEGRGVTRQMLSMVEQAKAKPSTDLLAKLAAVLGCDMDDLHT